MLLKEVGTLKNLTINKLIYFDEITLDTFSKASDQYQTFFTEYNKQKEYNFLLLIKDNTELQDKTLYELIYFDEITSGTIKSAPDAYKTFFEAYHAQDKYKSLLSEIETNNQFRDIQVTNNILTPNKCSPENILLGSFLSIAALLILYMGVKYLNYTNPSQENVIENNTDPSLDT